MKERTSQILQSIVREFIETGEPVSSERLFENYDFGIRPAMIRAELSDLTQDGYLAQPHHSAGRIPSNKGYEFYAELVMKEAQPEIPGHEVISLLKNGAIKDLVESISEELNVLGVATRDDAKSVYKDGLANLFEDLKINSLLNVRQIIQDFEELDERMHHVENIFDENFLEVFVGKKSPVTTSDDLSVIMGDYYTKDGRMFLLAIGPKYMDYEKPLKIFRGLKEIM